MSHQYVDKTELKTFLGMSGSGQDNNLDFALDARSLLLMTSVVEFLLPLLLRIVIMTVSLLILLMLMI